MIELSAVEARTAAVDLFAAAGVRRDEAIETANALLLADRWGIASHGFGRLPWYLRRLTAGGINPAATLRVVAERDATLALDGESGLGHWQAWRAAEAASERAGDHGIAVVSVANSSHCGSLGIYTLPMIERGFVGLVFSNGPAMMPPWGGAVPLLSTSPIAAGIPCGEQAAIVDLALSSVARGKIFQHALDKRPLPEGWALDADGRPTVDPEVALAGMLAPLGGVKGFALAVLVESLTGGLVGPSLSGDVVDMFDADALDQPQRVSHLLLAIDPAAVDGDGGGPQRLRDLAERVEQAGGRLPGTRRGRDLDPGAHEVIAIHPVTAAELHEWASTRGVALPDGLHADREGEGAATSR